MMKGFYNLNERKQEAYLKMVDAIFAMENKITVPLRSKAEVEEVHEKMWFDLPEVRIISRNQYGFILNTRGNQVVDATILFQYRGTREEIRNKMQEIDKVAEKIIEQSISKKNMNDEQCMEAIYKNLRNYMKFSILDKNGKYPEHAYTLECLLHKNGVCEGMARAYSYILKKLQIPSMVIIGTADGGDEVGDHAWNLVQMSDGTYRHLDLSWDVSLCGDDYWALDDLAMGARRHRWNAWEYPTCL